MKKGDALLIGLDIKKNPKTIHNVYFDKHGITKRFNLNLLSRINKEFDGDFKLDDFDFYCHYDPKNGEVNSYIISLRNQTVVLKKIDVELNFKYDELIWTELSKKYTLEDIGRLAATSGFEVEKHFLDSKNYFTDTLLTK